MTSCFVQRLFTRFRVVQNQSRGFTLFSYIMCAFIHTFLDCCCLFIMYSDVSDVLCDPCGCPMPFSLLRITSVAVRLWIIYSRLVMYWFWKESFWRCTTTIQMRNDHTNFYYLLGIIGLPLFMKTLITIKITSLKIKNILIHNSYFNFVLFEWKNVMFYMNFFRISTGKGGETKHVLNKSIWKSLLHTASGCKNRPEEMRFILTRFRSGDESDDDRTERFTVFVYVQWDER